ncbi:hypothetical protein NC652_026747 [Populus alba x Populus x berolinensis]|uniref:Uncharacterized protein n=1 Tax=Populus alba x Populus x berolinensis TaxID=444605 RepID=A0AAD6QA45_9ROSI|nr:hypothetical protein NC652_026747 [Populus alba x Populus x berolinensis]KAJ6983465.1 hypothetical protein NC653_026313 [Populus alba x Populus x berolinensis]
MISLRSLLKSLQGSLGTTRSLPLLLGRSRLQSDWFCLENLLSMLFLKGLRPLPSSLALRWIGFVWVFCGFCGVSLCV